MCLRVPCPHIFIFIMKLVRFYEAAGRISGLERVKYIFAGRYTKIFIWILNSFVNMGHYNIIFSCSPFSPTRLRKNGMAVENENYNTKRPPKQDFHLISFDVNRSWKIASTVLYSFLGHLDLTSKTIQSRI